MAIPKAIPAIDDLATLRDWLRYGVTAFTRAGLVYGHGTATALDEAAFLILSTLHLPVDTLQPWLDCRLTRAERQSVAEIFTARIETRKPAPYLTNSAWIGGHKFYVDERVIVPRSFIGELLCRDGLATVVGDGAHVTRILDLCTGSGCLAILAALAFPDADVIASDVSRDALDVAKRNVAEYKLADRVKIIQADLLSGLREKPFDLIISNPPYVTSEAVEAFPAEYKAEPKLAHDGGNDGLDLVHRILADARNHLTPTGSLVMEIGQGRDRLEAVRPDLPYLWLDTETSEGEVFALTAADLAGPVTPTLGGRKNQKT